MTKRKKKPQYVSLLTRVPREHKDLIVRRADERGTNQAIESRAVFAAGLKALGLAA